MMFFDVHCHLSFPQFDEDRGDVIERAKTNGVSIINSSVGLGEVPLAHKLSREFDNVYWALGLSASELDEEKVDGTIELIKKYRESIVAVGEVGLDYYWVKDEGERHFERENFRRFIEVSNELDLPLIVHSRDAEGDALALLDDYSKIALLHCFSGSLELALEAASKGYLISIPTNVTYVKSRQKLAAKLPIESIVLETDAPYLAPKPKTRNEPANIPAAAEKIAKLRGMSVEDVAFETTKNALEFYQLNK